MARLTKDEYKKRILVISRKIVDGENTAELAESITVQYSVKIRQAWNYIRAAKEQLAEISTEEKRLIFAEHIAARRSIRQRAKKTGDLRAELSALQDEAKMWGLYEPEGIAIVDWRKEVADKGIDAGELFGELVNKFAGVISESG